MTITLDALSGKFGSPHDTSSSSGSNTHIVGSGDNRILIAHISGQDDTRSVSSVTYGGIDLTLLRRTVQTNGLGSWAEIWYLVAPAVGSATLAVTLSAATEWTAGGSSWFGVDQNDPFSADDGAISTGTSISKAIASSIGEVVIDAVAQHAGVGTGPAISLTEGANQSVIYKGNSGDFSNAMGGGASYEDGVDGNVTMSWSSNWSGNNSITVASMREAVVGRGRLDKYRTDLYDDQQRILDDLGEPVKGYEIEPDNWFRMMGVLTPTVTEELSFVDDPRLMYIEEVSWSQNGDQTSMIGSRQDIDEIMLRRASQGRSS